MEPLGRVAAIVGVVFVVTQLTRPGSTAKIVSWVILNIQGAGIVILLVGPIVGGVITWALGGTVEKA